MLAPLLVMLLIGGTSGELTVSVSDTDAIEYSGDAGIVDN